VVTGAGSPDGIGYATARVLARAGHPIVIVSTTARIKDRAAELRAGGGDVHGVIADLTNEADVERLLEYATALGAVQVLVNNAGMAILGAIDEPGPIERLDLGDWQRSLERNLTTAFLAGLVGFTRAVALEAASCGVTVNAIAPGWIATGSQTEREAAAGLRTPLRRSGTPNEIAALIAFLASREASYITGQLIVADGGNALLEDHNA
jgi:3-oxoacyl-[acyl-carrier protein] reductase